MYDFEYLSGKRKVSQLIVLYSYDTGVWRGRLIDAVQRDTGATRVGPDHLLYCLRGDSLFDLGKRFICDLNTQLPSELMELMLEDIGQPEPRLAGLLYQGDGVVTKHPQWTALARKASLVEEPRVTPRNLAPLLRYLGETTDLADNPACVRQRGFSRCFDDLALAEAPLPALLQRFDFLLATSDPATNIVNIDEIAGGEGARPILNGVDRLLRDPSETQIARLMAENSRYLVNGHSWESLIRAISGKLASTLSSIAKQGGSGGRGFPTRTSVIQLSALVVSAWRELVPPGVLGPTRNDLVRLDGLLRTFSDCRENGDPLRGNSDSFRRNVISANRVEGAVGTALPRSLQRLLSAMTSAVSMPSEMRPMWIANLDTQLSAQPLSIEPTPHQHSGVVKTFEEVLNQDSAVVTIRTLLPRYRPTRDPERAATGEPALLVHGPGLGKVAFAQLIVRGLLCKATDGDLPCGVCDACEGFEREMGNGGVPNGAAEDIEERLRRYVSQSRQPSLATRWALIIDNVDRCDPSAFDTLLKTLEDHPANIVFVLIADDLQAVGEAVRSRSIDVELRPMTVE